MFEPDEFIFTKLAYYFKRRSKKKQADILHAVNLSDLKVLRNEIIENVAEKILTQEKSVSVIDENNQIVGTVHPSKIIHTVFGGKKNND